MKHFIFNTSMLLTIISCAQGQKIPTDPGIWGTYGCELSFAGNEIHMIDLKTEEEPGLAWIDGMNFVNGSIELDIKGKNQAGNSFVGLAFHGLDDSTYDAVYFRPFNFKSETKHKHAVQLISPPQYEWHNLRKAYPGHYENEVTPVPDPDDWFHARIEINYPWVTVYVNGAETPSLKVKQISERKEGKLGLWIGSEDGWFRNIQVKKMSGS